jgi:hypothetical protein
MARREEPVMPDTGLPWEIPYLDGTEFVKDYPQASEDLADAIVDALDDLQDGIDAAGGLVEVKQAIKTGTQSSSLGAGATAAISGLSITHEVADAAHKVILIVNVVGAMGFSNRSLGIRLKADATAIGVGDAASSRPRITTAGGVNSGTHNTVTAAATVLYTPGAGSIVYSVELVNLQDGTATNHVNRTESDANDARGGRAVSTLTLMEIRV